MAFRTVFGTEVAVVLDCFEVFVERPSSKLPKAQTWSHSKHRNKVKHLIGIAPQGVITFISKGCGGRTSVLTKSCGILDNLQTGDSVLADRGFTIADMVGMYSARLEIPEFTRGKAKLSACEVEQIRKLENVRIHVERVIGLLRKKYAILSSAIPIDLVNNKNDENLAPLDKVVAVCAALSNLCHSCAI